MVLIKCENDVDVLPSCHCASPHWVEYQIQRLLEPENWCHLNSVQWKAHRGLNVSMTLLHNASSLFSCSSVNALWHRKDKTSSRERPLGPASSSSPPSTIESRKKTESQSRGDYALIQMGGVTQQKRRRRWGYPPPSPFFSPISYLLDHIY